MKREDLIKFYNAYRLYIFPAVVAFSSIFLIIFAIYPQTIKLIDNQKTAGDIMTKSKFLESKVSALESYDEEDLSRKLTIALNAFPSEKDFGNTLGLLQQLVAVSGFTITSISLGNSTNKIGNSDSFSINLEVKGNKALLQNLLDNLESAPRLLRIGTIDISSNKVYETLSVVLGLQVLYSLPPQTAGEADSPLPELSQKDEEALITLSKISASIPKTNLQTSRGKSNPFE